MEFFSIAGSWNRKSTSFALTSILVSIAIAFPVSGSDAWDAVALESGTLEAKQGPKPAVPQIAMPEPSIVFPTVQLILDARTNDRQRNAAIVQHSDIAADLLAAMVSDLLESEENEIASRIPSIWKVAITTGTNNDTDQIARVLDVGLPTSDGELAPWQAVVVGGGIINGLSQEGIWPAERIEEIVGDDSFMQQRWQRAILLAAKLAEDGSIPAGTRYDALRIVAMQNWEQSKAVLVPLLSRDTAPELQQGAVSAVVDTRNPDAAATLIASLSELTEHNRAIAISGMFRSYHRTNLLREALGNGEAQTHWLTEEQQSRLQSLSSLHQFGMSW